MVSRFQGNDLSLIDSEEVITGIEFNDPGCLRIQSCQRKTQFHHFPLSFNNRVTVGAKDQLDEFILQLFEPDMEFLALAKFVSPLPSSTDEFLTLILPLYSIANFAVA